MSFTHDQKTVAKETCLFQQLKDWAPPCLAFLTRHEIPYTSNEYYAVVGSGDEDIPTLQGLAYN
jgi:hypothetical protein